MGLLGSARQVAEQLTGTRILRRVPRGLDVFDDLATSLPAHRVELIMDVGANIGQSAAEYVSRFPTARVHCFEPVAETFRELVVRTGSMPNVHCHRVALADEPGEGCVTTAGGSDSVLNHLVTGSPGAPADTGTEAVPRGTIDQFCQDQGISCVSYLKIDTGWRTGRAARGGTTPPRRIDRPAGGRSRHAPRERPTRTVP